MHVSSMDNFGHRFNFFMNGQTSTKTLPGFIFTLLAASLSVASFYIFYNAMVDRTTPTIQVSKMVTQDSQEITFHQDLFLFTLLVNFGTLLPRSYVPLFGKIKVQLVYEEITQTPYPDFGNNTDSYTVTSFDLVACNETKAFQHYKQYLSPELIITVTLAGFCIPDLTPEQQKYWTLRSTTGQVYSQRKVSVQLLPCQLAAGCIPWIGKKDLMFYVATIEKAYNGLDFEQPIITLLNGENRFLPLEGMHKSVDIAFSKFLSKTDSGLLFSSIKEESGIRYEGISPYDYAPWGGTVNSPLITVNLVASLKQTNYLRAYGKATDLVSNLGGIMQVTMSVIAVIYSIYNQYVRKRDLVVYGIMDMLPPEIEEPKRTDNPAKRSAKTQNRSSEEIQSETRGRGSELHPDGLHRQKTTFLDTKMHMGSFWKYICLRGNPRKKRAAASLKSLQEFRRHEYWNDCERLLGQTTELTIILPMMNEFEILRAVFFTNYHERLAPRVGIHYLHQDRKERLLYKDILSEEIAELLKAKTHGQSVEVYSESSSRGQQTSPRNNVSITYGGSLITSIKDRISQQVLQKYDDYKQREKANFEIFSGIKEFLESAAFAGLKDFIGPNGMLDQARKQSMKNLSANAGQDSRIELTVGRSTKKFFPSSLRAIDDIGLGTQGQLLKPNGRKPISSAERPDSLHLPATLALRPSDSPELSLQLPLPMQSTILSGRMIKNIPKVVSNQKIGVNSNPQLVRVKLAANQSGLGVGSNGASLNGAKPITVGASSTQHIHLSKADEKKPKHEEEALQVDGGKLSLLGIMRGTKGKPRASKEIKAPVQKKSIGTGSLQRLPLQKS